NYGSGGVRNGPGERTLSCLGVCDGSPKQNYAEQRASKWLKHLAASFWSCLACSDNYIPSGGKWNDIIPGLPGHTGEVVMSLQRGRLLGAGIVLWALTPGALFSQTT